MFSRCGDVLRIIMGLDKHRKTPCGFCFVVYYTRKDAEDAVKYLSGTKVDERPIRVDFDWGFMEGRQFGRGRAGGQVCSSTVFLFILCIFRQTILGIACTQYCEPCTESEMHHFVTLRWSEMKCAKGQCLKLMDLSKIDFSWWIFWCSIMHIAKAKVLANFAAHFIISL